MCVTQFEFVLGGPADAVVLKKLLQQLALIQELKTLNSVNRIYNINMLKTPHYAF